MTVVTAPPPGVPNARAARHVVSVLIGSSLVLKSLGFCWDYVGYYVADGTGHGTTAAGAALTLFGVGWCVGQAAAGVLTDRLGPRNALTLLMAVASTACFALAAAESLPSLLAASLFLGLTMEVHRPALSAAINAQIESAAARTRAQTWSYWTMNLGIAICGGAGGYFAHHHGYKALFIVNGMACVGFSLLARGIVPDKTSPTVQCRSEIRYRQVLSDSTLRWIAAVTALAMICAVGLITLLPLLMTADGLPPSAFGLAMVANTVAVLILTPLLSRLLIGRGEVMRFPLVPILAVGCLFLGFGMAFASLQHTTIGYAIAAVITVPGEIAYSVAVGAYISSAAPDAATGRYQAVLSGATAIASLPPLAMALALQAGGRPLVASVIAACGLSAALLCLPLARSLRLRSAAKPPGTA